MTMYQAYTEDMCMQREPLWNRSTANHFPWYVISPDWSARESNCYNLMKINILLNLSRDSSVGIATGYGLDDRGVGVRVPVGSRIFCSPLRPDRLWGPHNNLSNGYWGSFLGGKADGAWSGPLTSSQCRHQENVDLYIHSPILLHGIVLNSLSTGTTLSFC
jgi:hypothetical protein